MLNDDEYQFSPVLNLYSVMLYRFLFTIINYRVYDTYMRQLILEHPLPGNDSGMSVVPKPSHYSVLVNIPVLFRQLVECIKHWLR